MDERDSHSVCSATRIGQDPANPAAAVTATTASAIARTVFLVNHRGSYMPAVTHRTRLGVAVT
jgi:hypothetical protein